MEAVPAPSGQHVLGLISPVYGPFHLLPTGAGPQNSGKLKVLSRVDSKEDKRTWLVQIVVVMLNTSGQTDNFYSHCKCVN